MPVACKKGFSIISDEDAKDNNAEDETRLDNEDFLLQEKSVTQYPNHFLSVTIGFLS